MIIVTPAFLENTLPQDLQTLNSSIVAMREQVYDPYFTYCKNPTLANHNLNLIFFHKILIYKKAKDESARFKSMGSYAGFAVTRFEGKT